MSGTSYIYGDSRTERERDEEAGRIRRDERRMKKRKKRLCEVCKRSRPVTKKGQRALCSTKCALAVYDAYTSAFRSIARTVQYKMGQRLGLYGTEGR